MPPRTGAVDLHITLAPEMKRWLQGQARQQGQEVSRLVEQGVLLLQAPPSKSWTLPRGLTERLDQIVARLDAMTAQTTASDAWIQQADRRLDRLEKAQATDAANVASILAILRAIQDAPDKRSFLERLMHGAENGRS